MAGKLRAMLRLIGRAWNSEFLKHPIAYRTISGVLIVGIIAVIGLVANAVIGAISRPPHAERQQGQSESLKFTNTKVRPQPTNKKLVRNTDLSFVEELATFTFTVQNLGSKPISAESVGLLVDGIEKFQALATAAAYNAIDHMGDAEVWIDESVKVGDFIPAPIQLEIEPMAHRDFGVWFKSTAMPKNGVLRVRGRMQIRTPDSSTTSEPFEIEIHSDSQSHY